MTGIIKFPNFLGVCQMSEQSPQTIQFTREIISLFYDTQKASKPMCQCHNLEQKLKLSAVIVFAI